ncbi:unnamed protein product [Meloidogyne enterolobii]|uniref:Uncharacterized protein n=1 Tax=Meloidogyne enterolobii TaxID=390850 RepID=A0ACB1A494_MELEN
MLFFLLIFSLLSPLFIGMEQNGYWDVCCNSCWNGLGNLCPQNCWDLHLGECINHCWNSVCDYCNSFFRDQNVNQSDYQAIEDSECETEYNEDGSEGDVQEHRYTGVEWEEMPSTSQGQTDYYHYGKEVCEEEYEDDENEGRFREYDNTEEMWQEMPTASQGQTSNHYDNWDEDVSQYNPDIHIQFGGMNIGGKIS